MPQRSTLSPPPGVVLNASDYSIPGIWCAGNNVRPVGPKMQTIGGWQVLNASPGITNYCSGLLEWVGKDGTRRLACAGSDNVVVLYGSTLSSTTTITPGAYATSNLNRWTMGLWGDHLILNWSGHGIYEWSLGLGIAAAAVTNAPTTCTAILVTETRQLMALGTKEEVSGTFNPRCIRITDTEDNTVWATLPSNLACEVILDGAGGSIRTGANLPNKQVAVWTDDELFLGSFTGDPTNPWSFERQAVGCGCASVNLVTVADGTAYWVTPDLRMMMWVPGSEPFEIPGVPKYYIAGGQSGLTIAGLGLGFVWHNAMFNEIWFHAGATSTTIPTTYIAVNVDSIRNGAPQWFPGTMSRSVMYQGINGVYGFSSAALALLQHETGQHGYYLDAGHKDLLSWSLETLLYLHEGEQRVYLNRVLPDIESQAGNVTITVSTLDYPQGDETVKSTLTCAVSDDKKDFRASGKLWRFKFSGNDGGASQTNTFMRLGKTGFEYEVGGGR